MPEEFGGIMGGLFAMLDNGNFAHIFNVVSGKHFRIDLIMLIPGNNIYNNQVLSLVM